MKGETVAKESRLSKETFHRALEEGPNPAIAAGAIVLLLLLLFWWAEVNGLLPGFDSWRSQQLQLKVHDMAHRVAGDYNKLSTADQKWIEEVSHGHGRMAISMYSGVARRAPAQGGGNPGRRMGGNPTGRMGGNPAQRFRQPGPGTISPGASSGRVGSTTDTP